MTFYPGMNPNYNILECIEMYIENKSDYAAFEITNRIDQMKAENYTAALDLLAEAIGKDATELWVELEKKTKKHEQEVNRILVYQGRGKFYY